ncbi:MAG: NUDIX domain-containing protein [Candidatus Kerfeldbacteria bacterium]|nr:NUDIX domain-containing protein [Candidatus Kerfeldbacteria bacterium]
MPQFQVGLKAVIANPEGKILLIKRASTNTIAGYWDIPGGRMDFGEGLEAGLKREIKEEAGLDLATIAAPLSVTTFHPKVNPDVQIVRMIFWCTVASHNNVKLSEEHSEYGWFDLLDALKLNLYCNALKEALVRLAEYHELHFQPTTYLRTPDFSW